MNIVSTIVNHLVFSISADLYGYMRMSLSLDRLNGRINFSWAKAAERLTEYVAELS